MEIRTATDTGCFSQPFFAAANAVGWLTERDTGKCVYWSLLWAATADDRKSAEHARTIQQYCDGLEALTATE